MNKWLSSMPQMKDFTVNTSHTEYYIQYYQTKNAVTQVNESWKSIKSIIATLENDITAMKNCIDSEDYRSQTASIIKALEDAKAAIDTNFTRLFTAVVARMNAAAESDDWFAKTASTYSAYIATTILGLKGAQVIKANVEAFKNTAQTTETAQTTTTEEPKKTGFWGRVGATIGTFASGFVEGIVNIGEFAVDTATVGAAALMTPFTAAADAAGAITSKIKGTEYKSSTASMWKDAAGFVSKDYSTDWFDSYYENTSLGKTLKNNSYAFNFTRGAGKLAGEVATVNAIGGAVNAVRSGAQAVSSGTSLATSGGRVAASSSTELAVASGGGSTPLALSGSSQLAIGGPTLSSSTELAVTSSTTLPAVRSAGAITKATGASAYSSISGGNVAEILDASGKVIGTTTWGEAISATPVSSGASAFSSAARNFGAAAAKSSAGVTAASIAAVGGAAETIKQSNNSNS